MFKVKISDEGTVRSLDLSGRLLLGDPLDVLEKAVMATLTEGHKRIVFDFSNVGAWLERIRALPGWVHPYELMPGHPRPDAD